MISDQKDAETKSVRLAVGEREELPLATKVCFGIGNFPIIICKLAPKQLSLPIYNDALGVNPGLIGAILATSRIVDAAADTLMGHLSDRTVTRWGRRRPYIFFGAILTALFFATIWFFPRGLSQSGYITYFIVSTSLFYLALTVFSVPWYSLGYELPPSYNESTRLQSFANVFSPAAQIAVAWFYPITQLPIFSDTIEGVRFVGFAAGGAILIFGMIPALFVAEPKQRGIKAGKESPQKKLSFVKGMRDAIKCGPFLRLSIAFTSVLVGSSFANSLSFYLIVYYLFGGDRATASVFSGWSFTVSCLCSMLLTPVAAKLSIRFGKKEIFLLALWYGVARSVLVWFLLSPEHPWFLLINSVLAGFDGASIYTLCHAMIADICNMDELQSGESRAGLFGALYGWIYKTGNSLSLVAVGYMLVLIGFKSNAGGKPIVQGDQTLFFIKLGYCIIPALAYLAAGLIMRRYSITRDVAEDIRRQLKARNAKEVV